MTKIAIAAALMASSLGFASSAYAGKVCTDCTISAAGEVSCKSCSEK